MSLKSSISRLFVNASGKRRFRRHSGLGSHISRAARLARKSLFVEPLETRNLLAPIVDFGGPCAPDDLGTPEVQAAVVCRDGQVVGPDGKATFISTLAERDISRADPAHAGIPGAGIGLSDSMSADVLGDANGDGQFDQQDIVAVVRAAEYRTGQPATFAEGDWNCDGVFDQFEFMAALRTDRNVAGANAASSHGNRLTAVAGEGEGIVNVSPERSEPGFSVEIQVAVWNTSPNTTFNVKRAVDFTPDGICTSSSFVQFPLPNPGPLVQLTTSEGGAGATHIKFDRPQIADGTSFDVRFEVSTADASIVLRTTCFTVSVN